MWDWSTRGLSGWRGFSAPSWKGCLCSCFAFERAAHLAAAHEPARVVEGGEGQALEETVEEQKLPAAVRPPRRQPQELGHVAAHLTATT